MSLIDKSGHSSPTPCGCPILVLPDTIAMSKEYHFMFELLIPSDFLAQCLLAVSWQQYSLVTGLEHSDELEVFDPPVE